MPRKPSRLRPLGVALTGVALVLATTSLAFYLVSAPAESEAPERGVILISSYASKGAAAVTVSVPDVVPDKNDQVKVDFEIVLSERPVNRSPTLLMSGSFVDPGLNCVGESIERHPGLITWKDLTDLERLGMQRYELHPSGSGTIDEIGSRTFASALTEGEAVSIAAQASYLRITLDSTGFVDRKLAHEAVDGQPLSDGEDPGVEHHFSCYFERAQLWHSSGGLDGLSLWRHFDFPSVLAISNNAGTNTAIGREALRDYIFLKREATIPRDGDLAYTWSPLSEQQRPDAVLFAGSSHAEDAPSLTVELRGFSILVSSEWVGRAREVSLWLVAALIPLLLIISGRKAWSITKKLVTTGRFR